MDNFNFAQQGWQCPICKRVYSPFTTMCYYCGGECRTTATTSTKISTDWVEHQKEPSSFTSVSTGYATYTAEDIRTCDYCKHHNAAETLYCDCRECINYDKWEKV